MTQQTPQLPKEIREAFDRVEELVEAWVPRRHRDEALGDLEGLRCAFRDAMEAP